MGKIPEMSMFGGKKGEISSARKLYNAAGLSDVCDRIFIFSDLLEYIVTFRFHSSVMDKLIWRHLSDVTSDKRHKEIYKHLSMSDTCRLLYQMRCLSAAKDNCLLNEQGYSRIQTIKSIVESKLHKKRFKFYQLDKTYSSFSKPKELKCFDEIKSDSFGRCFWLVKSKYAGSKMILLQSDEDISYPDGFIDKEVNEFLDSIDNVISVSEYIILSYYISINMFLQSILQDYFFNIGELDTVHISSNSLSSQNMRYLMENDQDSVENYVRFDKFLKCLENTYKVPLSGKNFFETMSGLVLLNAWIMYKYFETHDYRKQLAIVRRLRMITDFLTQEDLNITPHGREFDYRPLGQFM